MTSANQKIKVALSLSLNLCEQKLGDEIQLLFDTKEESCHFFGFCIILTNTSFIGLLFGVSSLRFMSVLKEKKILNVILIEEFFWKFLTPILIAISMTIFITKDHHALMGMKQVKKHPLITLL